MKTKHKKLQAVSSRHHFPSPGIQDPLPQNKTSSAYVHCTLAILGMLPQVIHRKTQWIRKPKAASTYPGEAARSIGSPGTWLSALRWSPPPKNPEPPLGLAEGAQHAAIP
jgi:hypothetical protein